MTIVEDRRQIIEQLTPRLEADGYSVFLEPPRQLLPAFMQDYIPDAIAIRPRTLEPVKKNLAIEVKIEGAPNRFRAEDLERRFASAMDWELQVYYARPGGREPVPTMSGDAIDTALASVDRLAASDQLQAALLLGWATFEALGRALAPEKFDRPQTPGRLVEALANEGLVTPSEADALRALSNLRNQLSHGRLNQNVTPGDLSKLIEILRTLRETMNSPALA